MSADIDIDLTHPIDDLNWLLLPHNSIFAKDIPRILRSQIISSLWSSRKDSSKYDPYFQVFASVCERWRLSGRPVAIDTYRDFLDLVEHLKRHRTIARSSTVFLDFFPPISERDVSVPFSSPPVSNSRLEVPLAQRYSCCTRASLSNSLEITINLWLMISQDTFSPTDYVDGETIHWKDDWSLDDFIQTTFPSTCESDDQNYFQWDAAFNLNTIERIGGFNIVWTDALEDHLFLDEHFGRTIHVYHYASVLQTYRNEAASSGEGILPNAFLEETLQTLAILLPRSKSDCKRWFSKQQKRYPNIIDPQACDVPFESRKRRRTRFPYWHKRLSIIQEAFRDSEPEGLHRFWFDRRKKVQWYTFWVAILILILTVLFGLIQSVTSIMQVYAAYRSIPST